MTLYTTVVCILTYKAKALLLPLSQGFAYFIAKVCTSVVLEVCENTPLFHLPYNTLVTLLCTAQLYSPLSPQQKEQ